MLGLAVVLVGVFVHATIGTNAVPMPEQAATYRLALDGTATRVAAVPAPPIPVGYRSSQGTLAFTVRKSGIERLVVYDPATGVRRQVATRVCDVGTDPWSPDGTRVAVAVSLPHHGCDGRRLIVVAVSDVRTGRMRRITRPWTTPVAWTRDGRGLLIVKRDSTGSGDWSVVDPATGSGRRVLPSYEGFGTAGRWSSGHRFFAVTAIDAARRQTLVLLDGTLRNRVAAFTFGQLLAWAPRGPLVAYSNGAGIGILDAATRRVIATIPVHVPYGFSAEQLVWARDERSVTVVVMPGLGHD
jgi:hypothetical protein